MEIKRNYPEMYRELEILTNECNINGFGYTPREVLENFRHYLVLQKREHIGLIILDEIQEILENMLRSYVRPRKGNQPTVRCRIAPRSIVEYKEFKRKPLDRKITALAYSVVCEDAPYLGEIGFESELKKKGYTENSLDYQVAIASLQDAMVFLSRRDSRWFVGWGAWLDEGHGRKTLLKKREAEVPGGTAPYGNAGQVIGMLRMEKNFDRRMYNDAVNFYVLSEEERRELVRQRAGKCIPYDRNRINFFLNEGKEYIRVCVKSKHKLTPPEQKEVNRWEEILSKRDELID